MANYTFYDKKTKKTIDVSMPMDDLDGYMEANPHLEYQFSATPLADPTRLGLNKPDRGFRDVLNKVKKAHPLGKVNTW
jgi:hypothetical protein